MFKKPPLKIGLALSGGTAKSVAHIGVIQALEEAGIEISAISGTSGGSIVATAYASGLSIQEMKEMAKGLSWKNLASIRLTRLGFVSSERIETYMASIFGSDSLKFEDLSIPCAVPCTDLHSGERKVFKTGSIAKVVRMSCSLPNFYLPVEHENRYYIDGGLSEYMPVNTVSELDCDFVIGVNLGEFNNEIAGKPKHLFELFMQVNNLVARQNMRISQNIADFVIEPDMTEFKPFNFGRKDEIIQYGYEYAKKNITELIKQIDEKQLNDKRNIWNGLRRLLTSKPSK